MTPQVQSRVVCRMLFVAAHFVFCSSGLGVNVSFLNELLHGIALVPALVNRIESLFSGKSGVEKKNAAMSFLGSAFNMVEAASAREIVDPEKFKAGMSMIIDGTVECFRASTWAQGGGAGAAGEGVKSGS
jgi:hypothetical protein